MIFGHKKQDPVGKEVMLPAGPGSQPQPPGEASLWRLGEALIGRRTAKPASVLGEVFGLGPRLEKGAEMDHMETGAQRYCIWKANFPGCCRLEMSNCLKKQTP